MSISTDVFDERDDIVVSINRNRYRVSNDAFEIDHPDESTLSVVLKHRQEKVLDIRFLNEHIIRIYGHFRYPDAHDVVADENGLTYAPLTLGDGCAENARMALFDFE